MHALDTHKAVTRLETTGMSRQTAEAVVEIFDTVANAAATDLATKADLGAVAANVQHLSDRVQHLDDRVVVLEQTMATKSDLAEVRSDLAEVKTDIIKWNVGLILAVAAVMIAAVKLV